MIQYNNFLMKREQSRAGSRFAECEKSRLKAKILITLALLLTAVTGAWADGTLLTTINASSDFTSGSKTFDNIVTVTLDDVSYDANDGWYCGGSPRPVEVVPVNGVTVTGYMLYFSDTDPIEYEGSSFTVALEGYRVLADDISTQLGTVGITKIEVYGTAEAPITVEPVEGKTNEWTFSMPGSDVVLTPQYAPAAQLDKDGAPAAVSGLEIAADAAIITAGQSAQGTLLYAVTTSETEKPALTAFSATLPNAKDQTAAGTYYVWYYIQGHDTPQGQEPSADNTFNDSEIMGPVTVELLTNEHTLNIKQSPNITVTVAGTAVTPTDDKVTPVTTGQEVKIKANTGYKFRKVEVKKKAAIPLDNTTTAWTAGKYAVPAGGLTYSAAITVSGDVTLVLTDGETLTLNKGISLASGATLTVEGNGTMNVNGTNESTASTVAGSGTLVLTSGTLNAKGGNGQSLTIDPEVGNWDWNTGASGGVAINGNVTVSGGTVTATGGNGGNLNTSQISYCDGNHGGNGGAAISGTVTVNAGGWTATNGSNGTYTPGSDDNGCSAGTGGKAVAGTVTDNR